MHQSSSGVYCPGTSKNPLTSAELRDVVFSDTGSSVSKHFNEVSGLCVCVRVRVRVRVCVRVRVRVRVRVGVHVRVRSPGAALVCDVVPQPCAGHGRHAASGWCMRPAPSAQMRPRAPAPPAPAALSCLLASPRPGILLGNPLPPLPPPLLQCSFSKTVLTNDSSIAPPSVVVNVVPIPCNGTS